MDSPTCLLDAQASVSPGGPWRLGDTEMSHEASSGQGTGTGKEVTPGAAQP